MGTHLSLESDYPQPRAVKSPWLGQLIAFLRGSAARSLPLVVALLSVLASATWGAPTLADDLDFSNPATLVSGAACSSSTSCTIQGGGYSVATLNIPASVTVNATGALPLVVTAGTVSIDGALNASNGVAGGGTPGLNANENGGGGRTIDGSEVANGGMAAPAESWGYLGGGGGGGNGGGGGSGGAPGPGFVGGPSGAGGNGIGSGVAGGPSVSGDEPGVAGEGGALGGQGAGGGATCCGVHPGGAGGGGVTGSQGDPHLTVFCGGGGGGHGGCSLPGCTSGGQGGGGGGAIKVTSHATMSISGTLLANGGNGGFVGPGGYGGGGGGGAGGTIWLSATEINNTGSVRAVGGNGGGDNGAYGGAGGGGAGRIRVDTGNGLAPSGVFEPSIGYVDTFTVHTLTLDQLGSGRGLVTSFPTGIECGADCSQSYAQGTVVTLSAVPDSTSIFTGWSGAGCSGIGSCEVTMDAGRSVTATFADASAPMNPTAVQSTTHVIGRWSSDIMMTVVWSGAADVGAAGLAGYTVLFDTSPSSVPDDTVDVAHTGDPHSTTSGSLAEGNSHWFHLRTCDLAGNCTVAIHLGPFWIDATSPLVLLVNSLADTGDGILSEGETSSAPITQLFVTFDEEVVGAAEIATYLVLHDGGDGFQTLDCATGITVGDTAIPIDLASYHSPTRTAAIDVNGGVPLLDGVYRLLACGSTSVTDLAGNPLDGDGDGAGGDDFARNFTLLDTRATAHPGDDRTIDVDRSIVLGAFPAATGGASPYDYQWSVTPDTGVSLSSPTEANPTLSCSTPGVLTARLVVTDANSLESQPASAEITVVCPTQRDLFNEDFYGNRVFEATEIITAEKVNIKAGANVTLKAGKKVVLRSGLVVEEGSLFRLVIDPTTDCR